MAVRSRGEEPLGRQARSEKLPGRGEGRLARLAEARDAVVRGSADVLRELEILIPEVAAALPSMTVSPLEMPSALLTTTPVLPSADALAVLVFNAPGETASTGMTVQ